MYNQEFIDILIGKRKWLRSRSEKKISLPLSVIEPFLKDDNIYLKAKNFNKDDNLKEFNYNANIIFKEAIPNHKIFKYYIFINYDKSDYNQLYYFAYALAKIYYDRWLEETNNWPKDYEFDDLTNSENSNNAQFIKFSDDLLAPQYLIKNIKIYFKRYEDYKTSQIDKYLLSNILRVPVVVIHRQQNR